MDKCGEEGKQGRMEGFVEVGLEVNLEQGVEGKKGPGEESGEVPRNGELTKNYAKE